MKDWTASDLATLRTLWAAGKKARHIGAKLNRSRNSIIGKANRLGLVLGQADTTAHLVVVPDEPKTSTSTVAGCEYPLGNYPYTACGDAVHEGMSTRAYCRKHYTLCYRARIEESDKFVKEKMDRRRWNTGWGPAR
tara:strand:+ start:792 stop:1199 length:408 start_codon:yes stop_codon:yes gene_type:complete